MTIFLPLLILLAPISTDETLSVSVGSAEATMYYSPPEITVKAINARGEGSVSYFELDNNSYPIIGVEVAKNERSKSLTCDLGRFAAAATEISDYLSGPSYGMQTDGYDEALSFFLEQLKHCGWMAGRFQ